MRLELASFNIDRITPAARTRLSRGELQVNVEEIRELVLADENIRDVKIHLVHPGESVRIVHALDVVEPRHKVSGPGVVFPGVLGPPTSVGEGRTHRLSGMAIVTAGESVVGEPLYWREAIIDMTGPGVAHSPFSQTANLVLELVAREPSTPEERAEDNTIIGSGYSLSYNRSVRVAGFKVARYLAQVTADMTPDRVDVFELTPMDPGLPKVFYASQETGRFLYGGEMGWQPTLLHPNELADGVIFRTFNGPASFRESTYLYQNHPVVADLYRRHGRDLSFAGVLLYPLGGERLSEKERICSFASKLLHMLGAKGIVISWIGGGHPGIDLMLLCQKCEQLGIKTTILSPEMARTPDESGFVHYVPEADAIVSVGNYEEQVMLPPVDRVIGGRTLLLSDMDAEGALTVTVRYMYGASSPLGDGKLMGVQY